MDVDVEQPPAKPYARLQSGGPSPTTLSEWLRQFRLLFQIPGTWPANLAMVALAVAIGLFTGFGALAFTFLIQGFTWLFLENALRLQASDTVALAISGGALLFSVPIFGALVVSWFTRTFAPEAQGHGVPEVISAVTRQDGVIRPLVAIVKILASALSIGTGGSVGREGPIVQIGATFGSTAGQWFGLSSRSVKTLVACGAAAGISATFNAPMAGVVFASEIILGSMALESLTPVVISSVLANVVQLRFGEHGFNPVFPEIEYVYLGGPQQLPLFFLLGLACGLAAVGFIKLLYWLDDVMETWLPAWWARAIVAGALMGAVALLYPFRPADVPPAETIAEAEARAKGKSATVPESPDDVAVREAAKKDIQLPPLMGVGYEVVYFGLRLENEERPPEELPPEGGAPEGAGDEDEAEPNASPHGSPTVRLARSQMWTVLLWFLPLILLKPLLTSVALGGGGSGGVFAPSLFLGCALGASFGLFCNLILPPEYVLEPGVYAVLGMAAVVSGVTHGPVSAILIGYEMTGDYKIILPLMVAAVLASIVASLIDRDSIYLKKLSRRGEVATRGHELTVLEHVKVRDLMVWDFHVVHQAANLEGILKQARKNPSLETLPVMDDDGNLLGFIFSEDLHLIMHSDVDPALVRAEDIAVPIKTRITPNANLIEALRDFGAADVETIPVVAESGPTARLVGLLLRSDVMRRYREELLSD